MNIFKKLKTIKDSKDAHFLYIDNKTFKKYKFVIWLIVYFNKNYKWCEIYRHSYKNHINIVVFALRWHGKNVKRRTNGYAKEKVELGEVKYCIYCKSKLTRENATAEHIVPVAAGGNNAQVNLVVCCKSCNNQRGDSNFYEYMYSVRPELKGRRFFI